MKKFLVIGNPISHSLSPVIHDANFKSLGIEASYDKVRFEELNGIREYCKKNRISGFNVTLPFKENIVQFLDKTYIPEWCNAVNVVKIANERLIGYNTDMYGILEDFKELGIKLKCKKVLILGYGGLGKTLASLFRHQSATDIFVSECECIARNLEISEVKVANRTMKDGVDFEVDAQQMLEMIKDYDIVINATRIGTFDDPGLSLEASKMFNGYFYDCTPRHSPIVQRILSETVGKSSDGCGMLIHQAAKSFEIWFEKKANVQAMRTSIDAASNQA